MSFFEILFIKSLTTFTTNTYKSLLQNVTANLQKVFLLDIYFLCNPSDVINVQFNNSSPVHGAEAVLG